VQRRAAVIVPVVVGVLVLLAAPFTQAQVQETDYRYLPKSSETRAFYQDLATHFPSRTANPILVVAVRPGVSGAMSGRYLQRIRALPGVRSARVEAGSNGTLAVVDVTPDGPTQSQLSYGLVGEIRAMIAPFRTLVTGQAAELVDEKAALLRRLPFVVGFVVLATFVLLFLMTGSVVVPAKALAMNVLSLSASFGALVWVFQDGHLAGLLGFTPTGSVEIVVPVLVFAFAFGLSMDYEVFLLSRIKEAYDRTGDNDLAVAAGLQRTGRLVTTAALLMAAVFGGFAAGDMLAVKQVGVGLVLAVALDATLIRLLLVPATMKLMGRWNWWAPVPLRLLHARVGLREHPEPPRSRGVEMEEAPSLDPVG
jgi:RND superfamily putative drug exporter